MNEDEFNDRLDSGLTSFQKALYSIIPIVFLIWLGFGVAPELINSVSDFGVYQGIVLYILTIAGAYGLYNFWTKY